MYRISQHLRKIEFLPRELGDTGGNNHSKHLSYGYKGLHVNLFVFPICKTALHISRERQVSLLRTRVSGS